MTIKLKLFFMFIMLPPLLYGQNKLVEESIIYSSDISAEFNLQMQQNSD